ncbi:MAG TPA: hypothetical protein DCW29_06195, partial [Janthinobacterium sp.]|nr:hypothetical protein [Janthinobacterium sp.]
MFRQQFNPHKGVVMFPIPEQFSTAAKAQLEAQLKILNTLTGQAFKGAEQLIALNIHTGKAALENGAASAKQLFALKDPAELFKFGRSQAQPSLEHLLAYSRELFGIASGAQTELMRAARTEQSATTVTTLSAAAKPVVALESKVEPLAKPAAVVAKPEVVATKPAV